MGGIRPPMEKPTSTYPIGVKITGDLEVVNLSTKMQIKWFEAFLKKLEEFEFCKNRWWGRCR